MIQEKKPWQLTGKEETELGRKGAAVQESTSWLPREKSYLKKQCVEVVKRRKDGYVGNRSSPYGVQNREDSGAELKTAEYGKHCVPLGKSGNL